MEIECEIPKHSLFVVDCLLIYKQIRKMYIGMYESSFKHRFFKNLTWILKIQEVKVNLQSCFIIIPSFIRKMCTTCMTFFPPCNSDIKNQFKILSNEIFFQGNIWDLVRNLKHFPRHPRKNNHTGL